MSGYRGYNNYRGRTSKGKIVLTVVLILVILVSIGFMVLQKYVVYDAAGTPQLMLPGRETEEPALPPEEDEELRERILETFRRLPNGANAAFYQQGALSFDEVAAAAVLPRARGQGTVDVVVATLVGVPGEELLQRLQDYFQQRREIAIIRSVRFVRIGRSRRGRRRRSGRDFRRRRDGRIMMLWRWRRGRRGRGRWRGGGLRRRVAGRIIRRVV